MPDTKVVCQTFMSLLEKDMTLADGTKIPAGTNLLILPQTVSECILTPDGDSLARAWKKLERVGHVHAELEEEISQSVPKSGARGLLAGKEEATVLSGSQTITSDSSDCMVITTSGATTLAFTPAAQNVSAVKVLSLYASGATTLSISGAVWAFKGSAPTWGTAGHYLVMLAHFIGGRVVLTVTDNTQG